MDSDAPIPMKSLTKFSNDDFNRYGNQPSNNLPIAEAVAAGKKILFIGIILGSVIGIALTLIQKPVYEAHLSLEFHDMSTELAGLSPDSRNAIAGNITIDKYIETKAEILRSRSLISSVIDKLPADNIEAKSSNVLVELLKRQKHRLQYWLMMKNVPWFQPIDQREEAIDSAANGLTVNTSPTTRVVELTYTAQTPQNAALFLNTLAEQFITDNVSSRWQATRQTANWLTQQGIEFRNDLQRLEQQLEKASRSASLIGTSEKQDNVAAERLRQLQAELSLAQNDRIRRQTAFEAVKSVNPDTLPEMSADKEFTEHTSRRAELQQQRAELLTIYTVDNPKVTRLTTQLSELELIIQRQRENVIQRISNEYETAKRREELLSSAFSQQAIVVSGHAAEQAHYNLLKNEVETKRQIYNDMLHRVQDAGVVSAIRANNIQIIDRASIPSRPSKPRPVLNVLGFTMIGFLTSALILYTKERTNQSIRYPGDASILLGVPELGVIPAAGLIKTEPSSKESRQLIFNKITLVDIVSPQTNETDNRHTFPELHSWYERPSLMSESFRSALTSLQCISYTHKRASVIAITSPEAGSGKTTILSNLAISMSEIGQRVAILDFDFHRPRLHNIFNIANINGLSDILQGSTDISSYPTNDLLNKTDIPGIFVMPSGTATMNTSTLVRSNRFEQLLERLRTEVDMVLIDTPPSLVVSDTRVIAKKADGVLLVVRSNYTDRERASIAIEQLRQDGCRVLGSVLNDWRPKSKTHAYASGYIYESLERA